MSDHDENLVLEELHHLRIVVDSLSEEVGILKRLLSSVATQVADTHAEVGPNQQVTARIEKRLVRLEQRLGVGAGNQG